MLILKFLFSFQVCVWQSRQLFCSSFAVECCKFCTYLPFLVFVTLIAILQWSAAIIAFVLTFWWQFCSNVLQLLHLFWHFGCNFAVKCCIYCICFVIFFWILSPWFWIPTARFWILPWWIASEFLFSLIAFESRVN